MDGAFLLSVAAALLAGGGLLLLSGWSARREGLRIERRMSGLAHLAGARRGNARLGRLLERFGNRLAADPAGGPSAGRTQEAIQVGHALLCRLLALRFIVAALLIAAGAIAAAAGILRGPVMAMSPFVVAAAVYFGARPLIMLIAARRRAEAARELPFLLDLLVLILRSGASLDQAFRQVGQLDPRAMPHLVPIMAELVSDVDSGMGYEIALRRWAAKLGMDDAQDLANLFVQCILEGAEIGKRLKKMSDLHMEQRLLNARETAGRRLTHLTVTTMLFFIPPLILLLAAPVMNSTINALKVFNHG